MRKYFFRFIEFSSNSSVKCPAVRPLFHNHPCGDYTRVLSRHHSFLSVFLLLRSFKVSKISIENRLHFCTLILLKSRRNKREQSQHGEYSLAALRICRQHCVRARHDYRYENQTTDISLLELKIAYRNDKIKVIYVRWCLVNLHNRWFSVHHIFKISLYENSILLNPCG